MRRDNSHGESECRGRGSNPHVPFGTQDFKSFRGRFQDHAESFENSHEHLVGMAFSVDQSSPQSTARIRAKPQSMGSVRDHSVGKAPPAQTRPTPSLSIPRDLASLPVGIMN
jgi:hypothetical protein